MPLDTAVNNVGEYYAAHYLEHQFVKDIAGPVKAWRELGSRGVPKRLQALGDTYFKAKAQALDYDQTEHRAAAAEPELAGWHDALLRALGYAPAPESLVLVAERAALPVLCRLTRYGKPWLVAAETPFCLPDAALPADWGSEDPLEEAVPAGAAPDGTRHLEAAWGEAVGRLLREEDSPRWVLLLSGSLIHLFDRSTFAQGRWLRVDLDDAFGRKEAASFEAIAALLSAETLCPNSESATVLHDTLEGQSHKFTHGVSAKLQGAVRRAIEEVCNGWVDHRRARKLSYKTLAQGEPDLPGGVREVTADQLRDEALVFVYRILFCLYAEARGGELGILPINDDVYRLGYSLEALRDLADAGEMPMQAENGTYYHTHLKTLFRLIHQGFQPNRAPAAVDAAQPWAPVKPEQLQMFTNGPAAPRQLRLDQAGRKVMESDEGLAGAFVVRPLTATLFDPGATPLLDRAELPNIRLQRVIRELSLGADEKGKSIGRINYAELGIVQLGAVYEGLLSYSGFFATERLIQVHRALDKKRAAGPADDEGGDAEETEDAEALDDTSEDWAEEETGDDAADAAAGEAAGTLARAADGGTKVVYDDDIPADVQTWFVPESRAGEFREGEIVVERRSRRPRVYLPGEFILRLTGVDRANSASYYTPEVLTRCLVREVLNERLKGFGPADADRILELTVCEPAMGSAAFINEMCDQLAHAYLRLKQEQTGRTIEPGRYDDELRRVKHYIATRNVYGVDLNPTAVELGGLSLWLGSMHRLLVRKGEGAQPDVYRVGAVPWFGLRLRTGNSLIGARRAVWTSDQLRDGDHYGKDAAAPRTLKPGEARAANEIYHFLVWDEDMVPACRDKLMKSFWPAECKLGTDWTKKQVKKTWNEVDIAAAKAISAAIDDLWAQYARDRAAALKATACTASVWPTPSDSDEALRPGPTLDRQEEIRRTLEKTSGAFQRLRLIMDTWCAFYFWPIAQTDELPTREAWLAGLKILCGVDVGNAHARGLLAIQLGFQIAPEALFEAAQGELPDVAQLCQAMPCLLVGHDLSERQHFHHWELIFTELLGPAVEGLPVPRGIDLMAGNPPWIKVGWNDAPLLQEFDPALGVSGAKSAALKRARPELLKSEERKVDYRAVFEAGEGVSAFLNDRTLYPYLAGVQTNLYKNFIEKSWDLLGDEGVAGLIHQEGVFDDPDGGKFREAYYRRLRGHYQFENQMNLFEGTNDHGRMKFSLNVFSGASGEIEFSCIFNLFHPHTLEKCRAPSQVGTLLPGIKDDLNRWNTEGHPARVITITEAALKKIAPLFEEFGSPVTHARLPQVHGKPLLSVLEKVGKCERRLGSIFGGYHPTVMFEEGKAQNLGILHACRNGTKAPATLDQLVVAGPHFHIGRPWNKSPRLICNQPSHYDDVDLIELEEDYIPRTIYRPGDEDGDCSVFNQSIGFWPEQTLPGFWPIEEGEAPYWEDLCGEEIVLHSMDRNQPGTASARKYAFFSVAKGDVLGAINWLLHSSQKTTSIEFSNRFGDVCLKQGRPTSEDFALMPKPKTTYFRHVNRRKAKPSDSRTFISTIIPPGPTHVDSVYSIAFSDERNLLIFNGGCTSIIYDAICRQTGKEDFRHDVVSILPLLSGSAAEAILARSLRLAAVTVHYAPLWERNFSERMREDGWAYGEPRLVHEHELRWADLPTQWERGCALRSDYARRQALLEIDALVAQALDLTVDDLLTIYRVQFPKIRQYENADEYDARGRRLPNTVRKDAGAKELRAARQGHDGVSPITVSWPVDNGNATVTKTFHPPFTKVDREDDYRRAWAAFEARFGVATSEAPLTAADAED
ncbi:hypothetical protein [Azospirillum halopraeferens]|uniref:hypothetical protein n=1 Tax=Azospirillum halopraeferens TaxID=34010 RepID=UPI00040D0E07|nr:hypothetical protein [Azospirillum halopraeferens]